MKSEHKPVAVLYGATFGDLYASSLTSEDSPYQLAGILGRGGERSRQVAEKYGVSVLDSEQPLSEKIELGCVVVRSGLLGGKGSDIAQDLLKKSISIIQEHPVHIQELAQTIRIARKHNAAFYLNTFYERLDLVEQFISTASSLDHEDELLHLELVTSYQVAFAAVDILAIIGKGRLSLDEHPTPEVNDVINDISFRRVTGRLNSVFSFGLRIDMSMDPSDPDDHPHLLLKAELVTRRGTLTLVDSSGPLLWLPRPYVPKQGQTQAVIETLASADTRPFSEIVNSSWPNSVTRLLKIVAAERGTMRWLARAQRHLEVCRFWSEISQYIGQPVLRPNRVATEFSSKVSNA